MRHWRISAVLLLACHGASGASPKPVVNGTVVNYIPSQITIRGQNFSPSGIAPTVQFDGVNLAPLVSFTNQAVVANLPPSVPVGTYRLQITTSAGNSYQSAVFLGGPQVPTPIGVQGAHDLHTSGLLGFIREYPAFGSFFGSIISAIISAFVVWGVALGITKRLKRIEATFEFNKRFQDLIQQECKLKKEYQTASGGQYSSTSPKDDTDARNSWYRFFDLMLFEFHFYREGLLHRDNFVEWMTWRRFDYKENREVAGMTYRKGWGHWKKIPALQGNEFIALLNKIHVRKQIEVTDIVRQSVPGWWRRSRKAISGVKHIVRQYFSRWRRVWRATLSRGGGAWKAQ
jgi:hypothetical protein